MITKVPKCLFKQEEALLKNVKYVRGLALIYYQISDGQKR